MIKTKDDLKDYLSQDYSHFQKKADWKEWILKTERYYICKFLYILRHYEYSINNADTIWGKVRCLFWRIRFSHIVHKTQLYIFPNVCGPGLYLPHMGYILISSEGVIGKNCTLRPGTLIASNLGGGNSKPRKVVIGDNVEFSAGCKILCKKIGNNVSVGPNAVVTKNVPDNSIVMGNPGEIVPKIAL